MPVNPEQVVPIQADRVRAATCYARMKDRFWGYDEAANADVLQGRADESVLIQQFARHRIAHSPTDLSGREREIEEALAFLADAVGRWIECGPLRGIRNDLAKGHERALAALNPETHDG